MARHEHLQLAVTEAVAVVLGAHEVAEEIVVRHAAGPPLLDHTVDVLVEGVHRVEHDRPVVDQVEVEDLEQVVGEAAEQRPVLPRKAEHLTDDGDRVRLDEAHHVELVLVVDGVEELGHDASHHRSQAVGGLRSEGLGDEATEAGVLLAVEGEDAAARAVIELAVGDALHLEGQRRVGCGTSGHV